MSSHLILWICSEVTYLCLFLVMCLQFSLTLCATNTRNANESAFFSTCLNDLYGYRTVVFIYLFILIVMDHQHLLSIFLWRLLTFVYHCSNVLFSILFLYITVLQYVIFHVCIYHFHCVVVTPVSIPACFSFEMLTNVFWNIVLERIHSFLS
jgi:hypothetical protein